MGNKQNQTTVGSKLKLPEAPEAEDDAAAIEVTPDTETPDTTDAAGSDTVTEEVPNVEQEGSQEATDDNSQHEDTVEEIVSPEPPESVTEATQTFEAPTDQVKKTEYVATRDGKEGLWVVTVKGGGMVPGRLSGSYTELKLAQQEIDAYMRG